MIDLDNEARALLELARDAHDPGDDDRTRVRAALASRIGVAAGLGLAAGLGAAAKTTATATAGAGAGAGAGVTAGAIGAGAGALKLIGTALIVSATLGAGAAAVHHARRASVVRVAAVAERASSLSPRRAETVAAPAIAGPAVAPPAVGAPAAAAETAPPEVPAPESDPTHQSAKTASLDAPPGISNGAKKPSLAQATVPVVPAAPKQGHDDPTGVRAPARPSVPAVADEASLFHDGIVALRSGQPARALVLFDFHARLYPHGVLAEEREAERALALADLGRTTEARAAIDRFVQAHAASPLAARLLERARLLDPTGAKSGGADEPAGALDHRHDP